MDRKDIVYFVKDCSEDEELRYSLRSVEKNFPHGKVWFFGGCPKGLCPDVHVPIEQTQSSKYLRVRDMIKAAIDTEELSDNFWLFNDDFFAMSKLSYLLPTIDGSLDRKVHRIEKKYSGETAYTHRIRNTIYALREMGCDILSYEMHIPMEINKDAARKVLNVFTDDVAFRSAYGNYYNLAKAIHPDIKIVDVEQECDPDIHNVFLSTSDKSFKRGKVGKMIRSTFNVPSKYEIDCGDDDV